MGAEVLAIKETFDDEYERMTEYLSSEGGYWKKNDKWYLQESCFQEAGIKTGKSRKGLLADFSEYRSESLKMEMKYFLLYSMKNGLMSVSNIHVHYRKAIYELGLLITGKQPVHSFNGMDSGDRELLGVQMKPEMERLYLTLKHDVVSFIMDYYDDRDEMEKDKWKALKIPGVNISAAGKRQNASMNFKNIPHSYRTMVKRFMGRLVMKRSWSHSAEVLMYLRYFFRVFYENHYTDGFLEKLERRDIENYLGWVAADYAKKNATFRSKAVSIIRQFIEYIQLAEYPQAPQKDVFRLIFADDIPKRERAEDTMAKVKYIPEPVREQLDACIHEIKQEEMAPVYVLLRESGWRGTDVLNLRYDSCLDYLWNSQEKKYIPYLCGEITKTGIPVLKIPIRQEVADMVKKQADEAASQSTGENNPDRYLFNTYTGRCKGLPYSKAEFSAAVQSLIDEKGILDGEGNPYHFKAHALRHTRAQEYTEQGMPIGIIQQVLGHCSLQMTLHYSKVSENMLYQKWKETEILGLLHLESKPPIKEKQKNEDIRYEFIRKNLDAVRVPFGVCFKPSKLPCRQQISHCLDCANFCTSRDNIPEYEKEVVRVREQIKISKALGRDGWEEKNQIYLETLEKMLERIQKAGTVHKNGGLREETQDV